ncbi:DUF1249 domain-containing protein [Endozoicomonas sp. Mp262]|uniref:DUF1249 domain-containing protein n=1 Tax=Endozoicomonas sp. Mp262 TaxID=2919499 RepID=UPI0021D81269
MSKSLHKAAYRVDLVSQHGLCEVNYARLLKLLPDFLEQDYYQLSVTHGGEHGEHASEVAVRVLQRAPYTTLISLGMRASWNQWVSLPELEVRLYHDVRMAEVVMAQNIRRFPFVTEYPNKHMLPPNEKDMLNQFLSELLSFCMRGGHIMERVL